MASPPDSEPADSRGLERGEAVGRFVLLGLLGRGGMGEVYAAYDPELDRKVAVKILRARSADGEARLLREAQAIAKLQHPNVVVVYDVGKFHDTVFIAMEFVDGHTLGYWMNAETRPWRDVLRIFQAAGRGLEAAHALGMVHRDFKPDNVMLTKDGQIRVMDFGLARQMGDGGGTPPSMPAVDAAPELDPDRDLDSTVPLGKKAEPQPPSHLSSGGYLSLKLTQTGAQIGTPAYMAPEQFAAKRADARSDQFSFCVALYEALYGQRPFAGDTMLALMTHVLSAEVRPAPDKTRVPGWIRRVLLRGLSTDPDARFPSVKALLAALETDPSARPRKLALTLLGVAAVGGVAIAASRIGAGKTQLCAGASARFDGVWEPNVGSSPRREAIRAAFTATGKPFAAQAYASVARALDEYVGRWTAMYKDACEATHVRGEQSAEVLDLRMSCLGARVSNVRALSDVFAKADGDVVVNSVSAAGALPPLDGCADVAALRAVVKPPDDPAIRKRVAELREELARLSAMRDAGVCAPVEKRGLALIEEVRKTRYHPLLAEALFAVAFLGNHCSDPRLSAALGKEAVVEALAGHDDATAVRAAALVVVFVADRLSDLGGARDWLMVAKAMLSRVANGDYLVGEVLSAEGDVLGAEHDMEAWVAKTREAMTATVKVYGPDNVLSLTGLSNIGDALSAAGHFEEAVTADRLAIAASERALGPEHPLVASEHSNACEALNRARRNAEALAECDRALAIWKLLDTSAAIRSYGLTGRGLALLGLGRAADAVAPLEEAVATRTEAHLGAALESESRFALARALWSRPATKPRALALARQARADSGTDAKAVTEIDAWLARAR